MSKWSDVDALADLIRRRVPIEDVISDAVTLEKRGANWVGACPFHAADTNSLLVEPEPGFFYCYGCHASGNVIAFVQQAEGVSYPEAVRRLSELLPPLH
jgi:DNA primase